jgi:predicted DNA-binding transcriptional regulator YafY
MPMPKEHDTIASRLTQILMKFNNGESFTTKELSEEFNVQVRTIQKDLTQRLSFLPIEKKGTRYFLADYALGKLSLDDMKHFATFSGIRELYPKLSDDLIVDILNQKTNKALFVKGHSYEDLTHLIDEFNTIGAAIVAYKKIVFTYKDKERLVNPYRLNNVNGIWYMLATEGEVLKTFTFSQVKKLKILEESFEVEKHIVELIEDNTGTWITQNPIEVVLEVDNAVSDYFLRRQILPKQKTLESDEQMLILSTTVAYEEEILKIVRYWIPHIHIRSPKYLQEKLEKTLQNYLNKP